jgi:putative addiction module CopG family antidote
MSNTYTPGPEADAIVEQLLANGRYSSADEVVRASLQLLQPASRRARRSWRSCGA